MHYLSAVICGPGKIRESNQDNFYLNGAYREELEYMGTTELADESGRRALCAVADGMGGEAHGERASLMAVRALEEFDSEADAAEEFERLLLKCNDELCDFILENDCKRSGTTFSGLFLSGESAVSANIGDSRIYLFRSGSLRQLSTDDSVVEKLVERGVLSAEEARRHPLRHKLTQHLGIFPEEAAIRPRTERFGILPGDMFLLCSDGLYDMLEDGEIEGILREKEEPKAATAALYEAAVKAGGEDNITALLLRAES